MDINTVLKQNDEQEPVNPPIEEPTTPPEDEPSIPDNGCHKSCVMSWIYQTIPNFYDRVRSSLNVGNLIDDTTIDFFENAPMAELNIKKRVPNYEELDRMKRMLFDTCIIYMTCYSLCPLATTMRISRQKDPSLEIEFANSSKTEMPCDRFLGMIDDLIAQINDKELPYLFGFKVSRGSGCDLVKPFWRYHEHNAYTPLWGEK